MKCNHCNTEVGDCELYTLEPETHKDYGDFAICLDCFKQHPSNDKIYWTKWIEKK